MEEGVYVKWGGRKYLKTEDEFHIHLTDVSDNKLKADVSFIKDKKKSEEVTNKVKKTLQEALL